MNFKHIPQNDFEYIEAYVHHTLTNEELIKFEERLKTDKEFAANVEDVITSITGIETLALKEQLNLFHEELTSEEKDAQIDKTTTSFFKWKSIAVAAIVIVALGGIWYYNVNSNEGLYAKFYSVDPGLPTVMSNNDNYEFYNAMVYYKRGEYDLALNVWKEELKTKTKNDTLNYFVGSALMAKRQQADAIPFLQKVTMQKHSVFISDAWYYLALAYLKNEEKDKAIESLEQSNLPRARKLLKKLK